MDYKLKNDEAASCLECGSQLSGRKDKKFCCLHCKNQYNNRRHQNIKKYRNHVLTKISRNYEILEMLLNEGVKTIGIDSLNRLGFDPCHFTGCHKNAARHEECYCFDIAYSRTERKIFNIERIELTKA